MLIGQAASPRTRLLQDLQRLLHLRSGGMSGWSYSGEHGPEHWVDRDPACGGSAQSPINVNTRDAVPIAPGEGNLVIRGFDTMPSRLQMTNNGHTIQVNVKGDMSISGRELPGDYTLEQFHFHLGRVDSEGSEHTIDGKAAPMEMHFVHRNAKYASAREALTDPEGLAVLSVLFQISEDDNPKLNAVIEKLGNVDKPGATVNLDSFALLDILPSDIRRFYRYRGSLTTPPCSEAVAWIIFKDFVSISSAQIKAFRTIDHICGNFRPTQDLNGRTVDSV